MRFHVRIVGLLVVVILLCLIGRDYLIGSPPKPIVVGVDTPPTCDDSAQLQLPQPRVRGAHRLAVVVPYRDRWAELQQMVPHLADFLDAQGVDHQFWIVNQTDAWRFNRGSLLNAGSLVSEAFGCDYIALHDVDLLPNQPELNYHYPALGPYHVSAPGLHPKYKFSKFLGGILVMTRDHYADVNGFSNMFWGWGKEDDDFRRRILLRELTIYRPPHLKSGMKDTFLHVHGEERVRDTARHSGQERLFNTTDPSQGYSSVQWDHACIRQVRIDGRLVHFLNVALACDVAATPWCQVLPQQ